MAASGSPEEARIDLWAPDNVRWAADVVAATRLSEASRRFLVEVGLPRWLSLSLEWDAEAARLPPLADAPNYRRIGSEQGIPVCLDEGNFGRVVAVEPGQPVCFINSSVELLAEFLALHRQWSESYANGHAEDLARLAAMEGKMRSKDPAAFTDPANWWPQVLESGRDYWFP
jgi:hypothetical protein